MFGCEITVFEGDAGYLYPGWVVGVLSATACDATPHGFGLRFEVIDCFWGWSGMEMGGEMLEFKWGDLDNRGMLYFYQKTESPMASHPEISSIRNDRQKKQQTTHTHFTNKQYHNHDSSNTDTTITPNR